MCNPNVITNWEHSIDNLKGGGRQSFGPRGRVGEQMCRYRPERRLWSMQDYTWEVAERWQQRVTSMAAPQPPQFQQVTRCQHVQRASAYVTAFQAGIAIQLSEINSY